MAPFCGFGDCRGTFRGHSGRAPGWRQVMFRARTDAVWSKNSSLKTRPFLGVNCNAGRLSDFPFDIDLLRGVEVSFPAVPFVVAHLDLHVPWVAAMGTALRKNQNIEG